MSAVPVAVMGVASLLAVAVAMEPLARRLDVPLSLVLVVVGAFLHLLDRRLLREHRIEVEDFPAFILVDDKGNDFFKQLGL